MAAKKSGLGRGLNALIQDRSGTRRSGARGEGGTPAAEPKKAGSAKKRAEVPADADAAGVALEVPVASIEPNPWQPRTVFQPEELEELTASIKAQGVIQPLLVRTHEEGYQLIAGERRLRASMEAGLKQVPVRVLELEPRACLEIALVENLQRSDLNVVEEAEGYRRLMEEFSLTQEEVAAKVGKSRAAVANALRLLGLSDASRELLSSGHISAGHGKAILGLPVPAEQDALARRVAEEQLSVRATEELVQKHRKPAPKVRDNPTSDIPEAHLQHLGEELQRKLGTAVKITSTHTLTQGKRSPGKIEITYFHPDDLDRLLDLLGMTDPL